MMSEREEVAAKRVQCQSAVKALKEALETLESLPATLMSRINSAGQYATEPGGRPRPLLGAQTSSLFTKDSAAGFPARAPSLPLPIETQPSSPAGLSGVALLRTGAQDGSRRKVIVNVWPLPACKGFLAQEIRLQTLMSTAEAA